MQDWLKWNGASQSNVDLPLGPLSCAGQWGSHPLAAWATDEELLSDLKEELGKAVG